MKKTTFKPGFEFIFSVVLIAILALPPVLLAQNQKDLDIRIQNGDTTINGQHIKQLSATDRQTALKDISHITSDKSMMNDTAGIKLHRMETRKRNIAFGNQTMLLKDSVSIMSRPGADKFRGGPNKVMAFNERMRDRTDRNDRPEMRRYERRNTQNFDYINTDKEGISTHLRFHVSEANNDDLKKIPYVEGAKFELNDLNLVPEFSTGKTLLMFSLPSKKPAEVKLTDSEGKIEWTEKTSTGTFSKQFTIGLNGIYYLQVKQGNSVMVKRIVKED